MMKEYVDYLVEYGWSVESAKELLAELDAEWSAMDDYDRDWYDDYEDYLDTSLHKLFWSED